MRIADRPSDVPDPVVRAAAPPAFDLCCSRCGYGIAAHTSPTRCPMCGCDAAWAKSSNQASRRAALD
jgi:rubrerythrin